MLCTECVEGENYWDFRVVRLFPGRVDRIQLGVHEKFLEHVDEALLSHDFLEHGMAYKLRFIQLHEDSTS